MTTKLLIMRHNAIEPKNMLIGRTDVALSDYGLKKSKIISKSFSRLDCIYSSPLKRCLQTAEPISKSTRTPLIVDERLAEINFGIFEGMTKDEAKRLYPKIWENRQNNKWYFRPENGESYDDAWKRASLILTEIKRKFDGKTILLVTHATLINIILSKLTGMILEDLEENYIKPGHVFTVTLD